MHKNTLRPTRLIRFSDNLFFLFWSNVRLNLNRTQPTSVCVYAYFVSYSIGLGYLICGSLSSRVVTETWLWLFLAINKYIIYTMRRVQNVSNLLFWFHTKSSNNRTISVGTTSGQNITTPLFEGTSSISYCSNMKLGCYNEFRIHQSILFALFRLLWSNIIYLQTVKPPELQIYILGIFSCSKLNQNCYWKGTNLSHTNM